MNNRTLQSFTVLALCCFTSPLAWGFVTVLHEFDGASGGAAPNALPADLGAFFLGATSTGGANGTGALYRIDKDGNGFQTIHHFDAPGDTLGGGSFPAGRLAVSGGQVFGTANLGGEFSDGTIYRINSDGTGFTVTYAFDDETGDPAVLPMSGVIADGAILYGTTEDGGAEGSIYKLNSDGGGFEVLYTMAGDKSEGTGLLSPITLSGGVLYGVASQGGASNFGTLFRLDVNGANFAVLHEFTNGVDGGLPGGELLQTASLLYGVTERGGAGGKGILYRIQVDGTNYQELHAFAGGVLDGARPVGGLTLVGGRLFGVTAGGGPNDRGVVYSTLVDGTQFQLHHAFSGGDGETPVAGLTLDGGLLYGVTESGGTAGAGVLFALDPTRIAGDFNGDGVVDAADYTVWRDTLGSTTTLAADANYDGVVGPLDYGIWKANFGAVAASSAGLITTIVPEPASAILVICVGALSFGRRKIWR